MFACVIDPVVVVNVELILNEAIVAIKSVSNVSIVSILNIWTKTKRVFLFKIPCCWLLFACFYYRL